MPITPPLPAPTGSIDQALAAAYAPPTDSPPTKKPSRIDQALTSVYTSPEPGSNSSSPPSRIPGVAADDTRVAPGAGKAPDISGSASSAPWYQKVPEAIAGGLPGGRGAVALGTGIVDLLSGKGTDTALNDANQSLKTQKQDVASLPATARIPLEILGGSPLAALLAPAGVIGGGAAFGAIQGVDQPASSIGDRAIHTGVGGILGGGLGALLQGAGNLADRSGLTDAVSTLASKGLQKLGVSSDLTDAATAGLGTKGQVNKAMGTRQDLLSAVGDNGETAAKQQLDQQAEFKAQTDQNYARARQDTKVLQDPELNAQLQDPAVANVMRKVSAIRGSNGNPLPSPTTNTVLSPRDNGLLSSDDIASASSAFDQAYGRPGGPTTALPDPEAIHSLKRYLNDAVNRGMDSPLEITRDEARSLLPKAQAITARLHTLSPAYAAADAFHAQGLGEQEAYNAGVDAFRNAANPSADNLATNSAEGMQQAITTPRYASEPAEAMAGRYAAFQRGMRAAGGDIIRNAPVDKTMSGAINNLALANTEKAINLRKLMSDDPAQTQAREGTIGKLTGTVQQQDGSSGNSNQPVINKFSLLRKVARLATKPDLLKTPQGASLINLLSGDPTVLQQSLGNAQGVGSIAPSLMSLLSTDAAGQGTGAIFGPHTGQHR